MTKMYRLTGTYKFVDHDYPMCEFISSGQANDPQDAMKIAKTSLEENGCENIAFTKVEEKYNDYDWVEIPLSEI